MGEIRLISQIQSLPWMFKLVRLLGASDTNIVGAGSRWALVGGSRRFLEAIGNVNWNRHQASMFTYKQAVQDLEVEV